MSEFRPKSHSAKGPKRSHSPRLSQTGKSDGLVRRSTGSMAAAIATFKSPQKNGNVDSIEAEYIKNLQQQIYFLELETHYLREQAKRATDLHPQMSAEAERMLAKLRSMQEEMDGLQLENKRKENNIGLVYQERQLLQEQLRKEEEARARDKRLLMDEIIDLKKGITKLETEISFKDNQLIEVRNELDKSAATMKNAETKIIHLKMQLSQHIEQHKVTQLSRDKMRSELLSMETQLKSLEQKYYNSSINFQDKVVKDLREEICDLRQKLKEAELTAEQERHLRTKISNDSSSLVRENATLHQHIIEITKQLEREKNLRDEIEARNEAGIGEMVQSKDKEKELKFELEHAREQLRKEQERVSQCLEQVSHTESRTIQQELQLNTARSRVTELANAHQYLEKENTQLCKDKSLLVDHVAEIQQKLEHKNEEILNLKSQVLSLEERVEELEQINNLENTSQSHKWSEFEKLAESMRTLSHTMAVTRPPRSPHGTLKGSNKPMNF